ncbi:MAG TPA: hypothetical protein VN541_19410 [Tepidisphaeraceae bacterium]|nr:hypothetical protein [Tepidisphaeraceae bacterium]
MTFTPDLASLLSSDGMGPVGQAYTTFVSDSWRRYSDIGSRYVGRAVVTALEAMLSRDGGEDLMRHGFRNGMNYMIEMASIPTYAVADAATQYERERAVPRPSRDNVRIIDGKPIMLPVRFGAARQGWAAYYVDAASAQAALDHYGKEFQVCQLNGLATLVIYVVDFLQTDLGPYRELGVEFWVRPKANPAAMPGTVVARMSVDSHWSVKAAGDIWNFEKLFAPRMDPAYHRHSAQFPVDAQDDNTLAITLPRFGSHSSTDVPIRYFTTDRSGGPHHGQPLCTVFHRSTHGEGIQYGGDVQVRLGDGTGKNCFCAIDTKPRRVCTCDALRELGLPRLKAVANGWAEHMTGHVDPSFAVAPPPEHSHDHAATVSPAETPPETPRGTSAATPTSPSRRTRTGRRPA